MKGAARRHEFRRWRWRRRYLLWQRQVLETIGATIGTPAGEASHSPAGRLLGARATEMLPSDSSRIVRAEFLPRRLQQMIAHRLAGAVSVPFSCSTSGRDVVRRWRRAHREYDIVIRRDIFGECARDHPTISFRQRSRAPTTAATPTDDMPLDAVDQKLAVDLDNAAQLGRQGHMREPLHHRHVETLADQRMVAPRNDDEVNRPYRHDRNFR